MKVYIAIELVFGTNIFFILYLRFFLIVLFINIAIASKLERAKAIAVAIF